jgi:hypothetical protein
MNNIGSINSNEMLNLASSLNLNLPSQLSSIPENLFIKIPRVEEIKKELRNYIRLFSKYKLVQSSKWCSELLFSMNKPNNGKNQKKSKEKSQSSSSFRKILTCLMSPNPSMMIQFL